MKKGKYEDENKNMKKGNLVLWLIIRVPIYSLGKLLHINQGNMNEEWWIRAVRPFDCGAKGISSHC